MNTLLIQRLRTQLQEHLESATKDANFDQRTDQLATAIFQAEQLFELFNRRERALVDLEAYREERFKAVRMKQGELQVTIEAKRVEVGRKQLELERSREEHSSKLERKELEQQKLLIPVMEKYAAIWKEFKTRNEAEEHLLLVQAALSPRFAEFFILQHLIPIDRRGDKHRTVLAHFVALGRMEIVQRVLKAKPSPSLHVVDEGKKTLTYLAARWNPELLRLFCTREQLNRKERKQGRTPIARAVQKGVLENVRFLIGQGAELRCVDHQNNTLCHYAVQAEQNEEAILEILKIHAKELFESKNCQEQTPFFLALSLKKYHVAHWLYLNGAGANVYADAASKGDRQLITDLRFAQVDLEEKDESGKTPLAELVRRGDVKAARILKEEFQASVACKTTRGQNLLHLAVESENLDMVACVHAWDATLISQSDHDQLTPVMSIAPWPMIDRLLSFGAGLNSDDLKRLRHWDCFQDPKHVFDVAKNKFSSLLKQLQALELVKSAALVIAISNGDQQALALLVQCGPILFKEHKLLDDAANKDDPQLLETILPVVAPLDKNVFQRAVQNNRLKAVEWFRSKKVKLDLSTAFQQVPSVDMLEWLIKYHPTHILSPQDWQHVAKNTHDALYHRFVQLYIKQNWTDYYYLPPLHTLARLTLRWKY